MSSVEVSLNVGQPFFDAGRGFGEVLYPLIQKIPGVIVWAIALLNNTIFIDWPVVDVKAIVLHAGSVASFRITLEALKDLGVSILDSADILAIISLYIILGFA